MDTVVPKYNVCKIAGSRFGSKLSPETIEKLKNRSYDWMKKSWNTGKNSYFHIHKFSFSGEKNFNFSGYYRFKNLITQEEIITSKMQLSNKYNIDSSTVCAICNGKRKSAKKWVCLGKE